MLRMRKNCQNGVYASSIDEAATGISVSVTASLGSRVPVVLRTFIALLMTASVN